MKQKVKAVQYQLNFCYIRNIYKKCFRFLFSVPLMYLDTEVVFVTRCVDALLTQIKFNGEKLKKQAFIWTSNNFLRLIVFQGFPI